MSGSNGDRTHGDCPVGGRARGGDGHVHGGGPVPRPRHRQPRTHPFRGARPTGAGHPGCLLAPWFLRLRERDRRRRNSRNFAPRCSTRSERAPVARDAEVDAQGRPALGLEFERPSFTFVPPLTDSLGRHEAPRRPAPVQDDRARPGHGRAGTGRLHGLRDVPDDGARPAPVRAPATSAIAENINGPDFTPFNDAIFVKQPGLGGSVAWHQDGLTHWNAPNWDEGIHGFNFQVQLYATTPGSCLWVVPGTHKLGKVDIKAMVAENGGSDRLPDAVPLACEAGDVTMVNRQLLHASFANTSRDLRISMTFGFHRRSSVLGAKGALTNMEPVSTTRSGSSTGPRSSRWPSTPAASASPTKRLRLPAVRGARGRVSVESGDLRAGDPGLQHQGSRNLGGSRQARSPSEEFRGGRPSPRPASRPTRAGDLACARSCRTRCQIACQGNARYL